MQKLLSYRTAVSLAAVLAVAANASADFPGIPKKIFGGGKDTVEIAAKVTLAAAQVQGWCFAPPTERDFPGYAGKAALIIEMRNYNNNLSKYEVCSLETPAKQLVAAAELSKFSLISIADALTNIARAEQLKSDSINAIAERLKVTPAVELNYQEESQKLNEEIAKLQAEKVARGETIPLSPEAYLEVAIARGKLGAAASFLGQMLGTTVHVYKTVSLMSQSQQQAVFAQAAGLYQGQVDESAVERFAGNIGQIAQGTINGAGGLAQAAYKLGEVEAPENVEDVTASVETAVRVTNDEARQIVASIDNGSVI